MEWVREKKNKLDKPNVTVVCYSSGAGEIIASPSGVEIKVTIENYEELEPFAKAVSNSWKDHQQLRKAIYEKIILDN